LTRYGFQMRLDISKLKGTYPDADIERLIQRLEEVFPGSLERMHSVMRHPFRDNDKSMAESRRDLIQVARETEPFKSALANDASQLLIISQQVVSRVADMLGPIGSYDVEE